VKESIVTLSPPIQFWLKPSEVVSIGAGDTFDKAVLLCTMLIALGNISTNIITAIKDEKKKYVIYLEFKEKRFAIEIENGMREVKSKEDLLLEMGVHDEGEITAYEFNDKMYNDLS
jgi:tricorn protease-like protein